MLRYLVKVLVCFSSPRVVPSFWKTMWKIHVHHRLKLFVWRCFHDFIAVKQQLIRRKLMQEDVCPYCGKETGTSVHCLLLCGGPKFFLFASPLGLNIEMFVVMNFC